MDNLFLGSSQGLYSYSDLYKFKKYFLQFLYDSDHDFEKPIAFLADSCDTLIFGIVACWKLGLPFVCLSSDLTDAELNNQLSLIDPGILFLDKKNQHAINHDNKIAIQELNIQTALTTDIGLGQQAKNYEPSVDANSIFGYFFTSGTSGRPKVVPLKRRQMISAATSSAENFRPQKNHFWLLCLPLNHVSGITIVLRSLLYGSAIFRMKDFKPSRINKFLSENKLFQAASLVPTMLKKLLDKHQLRTHNEFKAILLGGGPINPSLVKKCNRRGIPLVPSYGMTETCAQITANPILKPRGMYGPMNSVGQIFRGNNIEIRNEENKPASANTSGTIWLKGPQVFDGYVNTTEDDHAKNNWFNTGDYGHINARGQLFIESRKSDMIITGGENVSPNEVEQALKSFDTIKEAAVFGLKDEHWGQQVTALVVCKNDENIMTEEIRSSLKSQIAGFKIPKVIIQSDSLPRTRTGKVKRNELPKIAASR